MFADARYDTKLTPIRQDSNTASWAGTPVPVFAFTVDHLSIPVGGMNRRVPGLIADIHHINPIDQTINNVSVPQIVESMAGRFGLPSRRELGIHAKHKPIGNERWRPKNCAVECPFWKARQSPPPGTVGLACEVFDWVEDNCDPARFEGDGGQYYRSPSLAEAMAVMGQ